MNKTLAKKIRRTLSLEQMTMLCSGKNNWETKSYPEQGVFSIKMADGPHGIRVEQSVEEDKIGIGEGLPATCFPTSALSACSFDVHLIEKMAAAIAREARAHQVDLILGPGLNIKRSPLCGRNFEYYSEDPYLSGYLAAAFVNGAASEKTGAVLKHFLANNQETRRMTVDVIADDRTLREIYLRGFEIALKHSHPLGIMCAYNSLNGEFMSQNKRYLTDILRKEWGYEGITMTDWGAVYDRVKGLDAGLDLEMPGSGGVNDQKIFEAVKKGRLKISRLNVSVERLIDCALQVQANRKVGVAAPNQAAHHALAEQIAEESMVLLRNEAALLPLNPQKEQTIAVIGKMAMEPVYQGGGSSKIYTKQVEIPFEALQKTAGNDVHWSWAAGCSEDMSEEEYLLEEAIRLAKASDRVLLFAGLSSDSETEGEDRKTLALPENQIRLIEAVCAVNPDTVLVLFSGGAVELNFDPMPRAILWAGLAGEAMGTALAKLLFGVVNPSGKLAETFPLKLADNPSYLNFPGMGDQVVYGEGVFVGYRYYSRVQRPVRYPFGHGLSYTRFTYQDLEVTHQDDEIMVSCRILNSGSVFGKETVQLYTGKEDSRIIRPVRELRAFDKVALSPGESAVVQFKLSLRDFMYYDPNEGAWRLEDGVHQIEIGSSSEAIQLQAGIELENPAPSHLTLYANLREVAGNPRGLALVEDYYRQFQEMTHQSIDAGDQFFMTLFERTPVIKMVSYSQGMVTEADLQGILDYINGEKDDYPNLMALCGQPEPEKNKFELFFENFFEHKNDAKSYSVDISVKELLSHPETCEILQKYCPPQYFTDEIIERVQSMGLTVRKIQRLIPDTYFPPALLKTIDQELKQVPYLAEKSE